MTDDLSDKDQRKRIGSPRPERESWNEVFAMLDDASAPEDFMADRDTSLPIEWEDP
jgi:hypothetical protein